MTYLLDTNVFVQHLRARGRASQLSDRLQAIDANNVFVGSVVRAELLAGAHHGRAPVDELKRVQSLLALFRSLPFDDRCADQYGKVRAALEARGGMIGSNDLMIACTALANGLTLVTHNCGEFNRVPGLSVEDWQT